MSGKENGLIQSRKKGQLQLGQIQKNACDYDEDKKEIPKSPKHT